MQKLIQWHPWEDPLARVLKNRSEQDEHDPEYHASLATFDEHYPSQIGEPGEEERGTGPCLLSPMGMIPLRESTLPSKLFNFWMGHANFDLDAEAVHLLEETPGVEGLDVFTRYRFRVAFGKMFDEKQVKAAIHERLNPPTPTFPAKDRFSPLRESLSKRHPCWAIYVNDDDSLEVAGGKTQDEVTQKGQRFTERAKLVVTSWGENA